MYAEPQKQKARNEALKYAIRTLTVSRYKSSIARRTYVREVKQYLQTKGSEFDIEVSSLLANSEIKRWEAFYDSIVGKRKASELRVAYLSGPNPINDIEVLVELGILPENIWAFESDKKTYDTAILTALESQFPFVKIYKGKIETFLKALPFRFDLIYLDFCKTVASANTISVVKAVFLNNALSPLGVMITNFSYPNEIGEENQAYRRNLNYLAANYLYSKPLTEAKTGGSFVEGAVTEGLMPDEYLELIKENSSDFYSQLITRILFDIPSIILPYQRLANDPALHQLFFKSFSEKSFDDDHEEDLASFPNQYAMVWSLTNQFGKDKSFNKFFNRLLNQLSIKNGAKQLLQSIELADYFKSEGLDIDLHSDRLAQIKKDWRFSKKYIFCDAFLFHQLKDILVGQLTGPYFYNVTYTKRWVYKAKETEMFMDLITYDQCRYVFDWMPTLDMFEEGVADWDRQLSLRFAMDAISKQNRWYNDEFFAGTAVIDQREKGFEAKELKKRKRIK